MEGNSTENGVRALQGELRWAEAALKRSKTKDYYKILGDRGETDIKMAYRESLKHHPDNIENGSLMLRNGRLHRKGTFWY